MAEVGDYTQLNGRDQAVKDHETLQKQKEKLKFTWSGIHLSELAPRSIIPQMEQHLSSAQLRELLMTTN